MFKLASFPYQLVGKDGSVRRPAVLKTSSLKKSDIMSMHRLLWKSRLLAEELIRWHPTGKSKLYIPNIGQEAAQIGSAYAAAETDEIDMPDLPWILSYARSHGAHLARVDPRLVMESFLYYGNMPPEVMQKFLDKRILPNYTAVGVHIPQATGIALGPVLTEDKIKPALAYYGDSATSEGDWYVGLNQATVLKSPVIHICENNQFGISERPWQQTATATFAEKAMSFGPDLAVEWVDGNDVLAMYVVTRLALVRALATCRPTIVVAETYRLGVHTTTLGAKHKQPPDELAEAKQYDPILRSYLFQTSDFAKNEYGIEWSEEQEKALREEVAKEIKAASGAAYETFLANRENTGRETVARNVSLHLESCINEQLLKAETQFNPKMFEGVSGRTAIALGIHDAITHFTRHDKNLKCGKPLVLGNDIEFGGVLSTMELTEEIAAKIYPELREKIKDGRLPLKIVLDKAIYDLPLDETGMAGVALGIALTGENGTPVYAEPQFSGFIWILMHQLQEAARLRQRTAGLLRIPLTVRLPFGASEGIDYHNESAEFNIISALPGTMVVCPWNLQRLYDFQIISAMQGKLTCLFEHHGLLGKDTGLTTLERRIPQETLEKLAIEKVVNGDSLTVVTYGKMVHTVKRILESQDIAGKGITANLLALQIASPFYPEQIIKSVKTTNGKLLVVCEEPMQYGFGAEIAAAISGTQESFEHLTMPIQRLGAPTEFTPAPVFMSRHVPQENEIKRKILEMTAG